MKMISVPIEAALVENADLGLKEKDPVIVMATIFVNHIVMVSEQTDKSALITITGGLDLVSTLSYSDVMNLLKID